MLGASAGWVLPYSYQCNLMVMAAGKYKTADFIKIGLPYHVRVHCTDGISSFVSVTDMLSLCDRACVALPRVVSTTLPLLVPLSCHVCEQQLPVGFAHARAYQAVLCLVPLICFCPAGVAVCGCAADPGQWRQMGHPPGGFHGLHRPHPYRSRRLRVCAE